VCLYAATKQAFEAVLEFYIDAHALRAITLKLFDTYGPGDPRPKLLSLLQKATATGAPLDLSPGEQLINPVYIDDVVEAFVLAGKRLLDGAPAGKEEYAVSSRHPLSVREFAAAYASASGRGLELRWCAQPYRAREVMVPWNTGASLPGWSPKVTLEEGIRRIAGCAPPGESQ
jgi:nucleoside-diphosphate-sugar epimerase